MHILKLRFILFVLAVLIGCITTTANADHDGPPFAECDSDLDCVPRTCHLDTYNGDYYEGACEELEYACVEDEFSGKFGYCNEVYSYSYGTEELCQTEGPGCREYYWTCNPENRCALGEHHFYPATCNVEDGQDWPTRTAYECSRGDDDYGYDEGIPYCEPYMEYAPDEDRCTYDGTPFLGGGTCSATNWICEDGIFEEIVTEGTDSCYDGDPDNPSLNFWRCATNDGSKADTCVVDTRDESDWCEDFGGNALGGGGCNATNWVCSGGTTLVELISGADDSCGGTEDNPSVTHWSCADPMDGTVADTCTSAPITRQDQCEQSGGDRYGGGSCRATDWYCDPGDFYNTAILRSDEMDVADTCSGDVASHFICGSADGGSLTDSCVPQQQDCDDPAVGGLGDVCSNGVCNSAGTYCIAQNRLPGDDCRNGDGNTYEGCDLPDTCNESGQCELNIKPALTVCRAGTGECNPEEVCRGVKGEACPEDDFKAEGESCGDGSIDNVCDAPDTCDGAGICQNNVKGSDFVCREGSRDDFCDPTEYCTGTPGDDCPVDYIEPPGTLCNEGSGDLCDPDERCTGVSGEDCPLDFVEPPTTVCKESSTGWEECDPTDFCPGRPDERCEDVIKEEGTACGSDSDTACTELDTCGGGDDRGICLPNNEPCALVTSSSLCTFDVQPDKGMCTETPQACVFDAACEAAGGAICGNGLCRNADGEPILDGQNHEIACTDPCRGDGIALDGETDWCRQTGQFRLVFTPDVKNFPAYKLPASNPGQTFYNAIVQGAPNTPVTVGIDIPYPYVTVGGQPVHVFDAYDAIGMCVNRSTGEATGQACDFKAYPDSECGDGEYCDSSCFAPTLPLQQFDIRWNIADYFAGEGMIDDPRVTCDEVCGPDGAGSCTFDVVVPIPASGQAYLNVHLDYGLKGVHEDANPCDGLADRYDQGDSSGTGFADVGFDAWVNNDAGDGTLGIGIADCTDYAFGHSVGEQTFGEQTFDDSVQNLNVFKPIAGAFGRSGDSQSGLGHGGLKLTLVKSSNPGTILQTATTDQDGFYTLPYKHKGKPAWYTVSLYDDTGSLLLGSIGIELQGNGWTQIDFDSYATFEELCDIDKAFCECNGWCAVAEYGSGRQSGGSSGGGGAVCELAQSGASCTEDGDCCSGACKGKPGEKTCK